MHFVIKFLKYLASIFFGNENAIAPARKELSPCSFDPKNYGLLLSIHAKDIRISSPEVLLYGYESGFLGNYFDFDFLNHEDMYFLGITWEHLAELSLDKNIDAVRFGMFIDRSSQNDTQIHFLQRINNNVFAYTITAKPSYGRWFKPLGFDRDPDAPLTVDCWVPREKGGCAIFIKPWRHGG